MTKTLKGCKIDNKIQIDKRKKNDFKIEFDL